MGFQITVILIIAAAAIVWFVKYQPGKLLKPDTSPKRPADSLLPVQKIPNDKLVVITGAAYEDVRRVLAGFCNRYNKDSYQVLLQLTDLPGTNNTILFPYDIDFDLFCFLVNYLNAPVELKWKVTVTGWSTDNVLKSKVMVYVPEDDTEYDDVWVTTPDNKIYQVPFGDTDQRKLLNTAGEVYRLPSGDPDLLKACSGELFR